MNRKPIIVTNYQKTKSMSIETIKEIKIKRAVNELIDVSEDSKKCLEEMVKLLQSYEQDKAANLVQKVIARTELAVANATLSINC